MIEGPAGAGQMVRSNRVRAAFQAGRCIVSPANALSSLRIVRVERDFKACRDAVMSLNNRGDKIYRSI